MRDNLEKWLASIVDSISEPHVPDHDQPVIRATCKNIRMHTMPGNILDRCTMMQDLHHWRSFVVLLFALFDIPDTNFLVALACG